ncbi:hypothetical protein [Streptomyces candidus]|uniref:Uncharacterized protein n=1 Tax=Streptomyces candidus TaxID=67283 RepID=A0A7X0HEU2_9ACTN|nr:hypothetical protein [Streptomyces candidus]MBB6436330.1 hypothetical protein [Streptomyces candidus]GHH48539.1 hypothetical protein GCM10018773_42730 [Streptomyces candidus]
MDTMVKAMLWMLLAVAVAANVLLGLGSVGDGALRIVLSALTGAVALAAVTGLVVVRRAARTS